VYKQLSREKDLKFRGKKLTIANRLSVLFALFIISRNLIVTFVLLALIKSIA